MSRRPDGALERDVLRALWRSSSALTPAEVRESLGGGLAYTTVMTILSRLHDKGLASRESRGRAYAYEATVSESELVASRMTAELSATNDRIGALSGFVSGLTRRDVDALRDLLESDPR